MSQLVLPPWVNDLPNYCLPSGSSISSGQELVYSKILQYASLLTNGDFQLYFNNGTVTWSTKTAGSGATQATLDDNGNFKLLDKNNKIVFSTGNTCPNSVATFSNNGYWVIYDNARN